MCGRSFITLQPLRYTDTVEDHAGVTMQQAKSVGSKPVVCVIHRHLIRKLKFPSLNISAF